MFSIIFTLLFSLLFAFLATHYLDIPTLSPFLVVLVSILVGFVMANITALVNKIKLKWTIRGQKGELKKTYKTVGELQVQVAKLEDENSILREQLKSVVIES